MITRSKHVEAVIRKHWRELIRGGGMWIDGYNNAVNKQCSTTITTRIDSANLWFFNDPRPRNETNPNKFMSGHKLHD